MNPNEIEKKLNDARNKGKTEIKKFQSSFFNESYKDDNIPSWFLELFKKAYWLIPTYLDNVSAVQIKVWIETPQSEWNFAQVGKMTEIIGLPPRYQLFDNMDEYFEKIQTIETLKGAMEIKLQVHNAKVKTKDEQLERKLNFMREDLMNPKGKDLRKQKKPAMAVAQ